MTVTLAGVALGAGEFWAEVGARDGGATVTVTPAKMPGAVIPAGF